MPPPKWKERKKKNPKHHKCSLTRAKDESHKRVDSSSLFLSLSLSLSTPLDDHEIYPKISLNFNIQQSWTLTKLKLKIKFTYTYAKIQANTVVQVRTLLLTSDFGSSTRGEKHNSYYGDPTNARRILCFKISVGRDSKIPTTCLNGREHNCQPPWSNLNSQLTLFQNPQILRTISSGHDIIHTPVQFPVWGLLWQWWLVISFAFERKLHQLTIHLRS